MNPIATLNGKRPATDKQARKAVVLWDAEWSEFRVRHFLGGVHQRRADYHTDDETDARGTAAKWIQAEVSAAPAQEEPTKEPRTLDMTPTWSAVLPVYVAVLEDGTEEGKSIARQELRRMAEAADKWNASAKGAK